MGGLPDRDADGDGEGGEDGAGDHLHAEAQALTCPPQFALAGLVLQVAQPERALFFELGGLSFQQGGLVAQELGRGARDFGIVPGLLLRQGGGERLGANPALAGLRLGRLLLAAEQAAQQTFSHRTPPAQLQPRRLSGLGHTARRRRPNFRLRVASCR